MSIKHHERVGMQSGEFYTLEGVIAEQRKAKDGDAVYPPVRKFSYPKNGKSLIGLNVSIWIREKVGGRETRRPVDCVCFNEKEHTKILKLKLKTDDRITVFGRAEQKPDGRNFSLIFEESEWISQIKPI